jgi:Met-zincin/Domain of unknown function (DUF5117)/Domain of unknown function (DUF5118)
MRGSALPWLLVLGLCSQLLATDEARADPPPAREILEGFRGDGGLFPVYRKDNEAFIEIPAAKLGQPFLLATSMAGGPRYTGFQWWTTVASWERLGDRLLLIEREVRYRVRDPRQPMAEIVRRTYTDRLLHSMPIAGLNGQNPVVPVDDLFAKQARTFFGDQARQLDQNVVRIEKLKSFPNNVELALTLPDKAQEGRFVTLAYSLSFLPDPRADRYRGRVADDRVGYFLTVVRDYTDDSEATDRFVRYVNRWNLEKADPSLERSPVKEPIVFYIENTVPFRYRQAIADGVSEWNRAFEQVGLQGAIVVRQQTDTEFADLDPEDVRYNFIRWIVSDRAFAMGPSRVNPWTGQILDADIVFDESMVRSYMREYDVSLRLDGRRFFGAEQVGELDRAPERYPFAHAPADMLSREQVEDAELARLDPLGDVDHRVCSLGQGLSHELSMGLMAARLDGGVEALGQPVPQAFLDEIVKDIVMHEVGHTLGLRHNFKASTWRTLAEINSAEAPDAICGSVMDYNPVNVRSTTDEPQGAYTMRTLGPYDVWAIRYGYGIYGNEAEALAALTAQVAQTEYTYATDEDVAGPDPHVARWDLSADPLDFAEARMNMVARLLDGVVERVVAEGQSYADARRAVDMLLYDHQSAALTAARFVGGIHINRDHRGDPDGRQPVVPVSAEQQRRALELICVRVLSAGNYEFSPEVLRSLGRGNWRHWGSNDTARPHAYPYQSRVLTVQAWALYGLLNPGTLERLLESEALVDPDADLLTVPEVFTRVSQAVFGGLLDGALDPKGASARSPLVPTLQRNLQRHYVGQLIAMTVENENSTTPAAVRTVARLEVTRLRDLLAVHDTNAYDLYTRAHLEEMQARIGQALDAGFRIGGGISGGSGLPSVGEGAPRGREPEHYESPDDLPWNR